MRDKLPHIVAVILLLLLLVFLNVSGVLDRPIDILRKVTEFSQTPFVYIFRPIKSNYDFFINLRKIGEENKFLTDQVAELKLDLANLERIQQENQSLRSALGFQSDSNFDLIPGEIITFDPLGQDQSAVINRGRIHGVKPGQAVIVAGGNLVGSITTVFEQTSEMELITSSEFSVNVESADGDARGILKGEHGLGLLLDLVSQNEQIEKGDLLLTSGLGGQFPRNLLVGEVTEIRSNSSELFQKATVSSIVNLKELEIVFVINR